MMHLCSDIIKQLSGKTLVTAESCTGGWIGKELTAIAGSSEVYKGGIICYTNFVKEQILGVDRDILKQHGAVSQETAGEMARGVRDLLKADISISVTGLAGPGADEYGNAVGTVFIGCAKDNEVVVKEFHFSGDRDCVRKQAVYEALKLVQSMIKKEPTD